MIRGTGVTRFAICIASMVKGNVSPVIGGVAAGTLTWPMTCWWRMTSCALCKVGMINTAYWPFSGGVAGRALPVPMASGRRMASLAICGPRMAKRNL